MRHASHQTMPNISAVPTPLFSILISCPRGLEYLLQDELLPFGLSNVRVSPQGVFADAPLETLYRICLWSRLANRIQIILFSASIRTAKDLHQSCYDYNWPNEFEAHRTIAVEFHGSSEEIRNAMFGAQVVKDAIIDCFRDRVGSRPCVDRDHPNILIHAHLKKDILTISLDFTGYSLHQRGYRLDALKAPLKENIAAAMLIRANWPKLCEQGYLLYDPCCGSGTLVIEAAMMAANIAPGLLREDQRFIYWSQHDEALWQAKRLETGHEKKPLSKRFMGSDIDKKAIIAATMNAERAGLSAYIDWQVGPFKQSHPPQGSPGLVICNPPYGERLSKPDDLVPLYQSLGQMLHEFYTGWSAAVLTSSPVLAKAMGLRATKQYRLYNGALDCKLYCIELGADNQLRDMSQPKSYLPPPSEQATMFANRLKKNLIHLQKWAKREQIQCYRIYDADIPEYAFAIDLYNDFVVLQEYAAPDSIPAEVAATRSKEVVQEVQRVLGFLPEKVVLKQRQQQKGTQQYEKHAKTNKFMVVNEGSAKLQVNLHDYLDTGLFLDHRRLRRYFASLPARTKFLNCFCYTGTASVFAAMAGATTTNVDLSNTYLNWAKANFELNQLNTARHQFIQEDCMVWLQQCSERFDVIFLDPPSFSNSKRMKQTMSIQRDHNLLIDASMRLLNPGGILYFSTNFRRFKLAPELSNAYEVENITTSTIDLDFKRNQRIHHCFKITQFVRA